MEEKPDIHLPSPSYWPIVLAFALTLISSGVIWGIFISLAGVILLLIAVAGWTLENRKTGQEEHHE